MTGTNITSIHIAPEADRDWLENLGFVWPAVDQEKDCFEALNEIVEIGSADPSAYNSYWFGSYSNKDEENKAMIYDARAIFLGQLSLLAPKTIKMAQNKKGYSQVPPSTVIGSQRLFVNYAIEGLTVVNEQPDIFKTTPETLETKINELAAIFPHATQSINKNPNLLNSSIQHIQEQLKALEENAQALRVTDIYQALTEYPILLGCKPEKIRTLGAIIAQASVKSDFTDFSLQELEPILMKNIEALLLGYLGNTVHGLADLAKRAGAYASVGKGNIRNLIINQYKDDPAVKVYLQGYPS